MKVWVVRHGCAGSKEAWPGSDEERPLDDEGLAQAASLADLLAENDPSVLCSSPTRRCRDTLEPLASRLGLPVHDVAVLRRSTTPTEAFEFLEALPDRAVVCTHGEVMTPLLGLFRRTGFHVADDAADETLLLKGSAWLVDLDARTLTDSTRVSTEWGELR